MSRHTAAAVTIRVAPGDVQGAGFSRWATKRDASAALRALRDTGRNTDRCVEIHPAVGALGFRCWVVGRPDPLGEFFWLMRRDGSWDRGRLFDGWTDARWCYQPGAGGPIPATIVHNCHYTGGYVECQMPGPTRYGLLGQPIPPPLSYLAQVWCVACVWKTHADDEHTARWAARAHRDSPGGLPLRTETGRLLHGQVMPGADPSGGAR